MILWQIYSENYTPSFIAIARVLYEILQKHSGLFFSGHSVVTVYRSNFLTDIETLCTNDGEFMS